MKKSAFVCLLVLVLAAGLALVFWRPLLRSTARLWIVSDSPAAAGVIIVPGGQIFSRPPKAAELYRAGYAPRIFIMREVYVPLLHADTPGAERAEYIAERLQETGVPREAIHMSAEKVSSTWEEGEQFAAWVRSLPPAERPKSALIVTDAFHSRRARWSFRRHTREFGIHYRVVTVAHRKYEPDTWWTSEPGRHDFVSEIEKMAYYRLKY